MLKIIVAALQIEARPLIRALGLKKDSTSPKIPLYRGDGVRLVVCGTGKLKAAVGTTYALTREAEPQKTIAVNFGFCGSADPRIATGSLFMINKITDAATNRSFFPDILLNHGLPESPLTTHDRPLIRAEYDEEASRRTGERELVDMEGSGFFMAASAFLGPERIICLKLVSDHLEGNRLDKDLLSAFIESQLPQIESCLDACDALAGPPPALNPEDATLLAALRPRLRLTTTQSHQLRDWATAYAIRRRRDLTILKPYLEQTVNNKAERNRLLAAIKDELLAP